MQYNEILQPRVNDVLFPFRIETLERLPGAKEYRTSTVATVKDEMGIAFNTSPPDATFQRPKKKAK